MPGQISEVERPRAYLRHLSIEGISPFDKSQAVKFPLVQNTLRWIAPWKKWEYPGKWRLIASILPRSVTRQGFHQWQNGQARVPEDIAVALSGYLRARGREAFQMADDWDAYAAGERARLRRHVGLCEVREDGRDRRGNWRR